MGVALVFDSPLTDELDGLRRAVGDPSLGRVPPHLTLVPPVNVKPSGLPDALSRLREAAAAQPGPLTLTLGPPATFLPANPVLYLAVGGDLDRLRKLRDGVFRPPLERSLSWPWVPHVTLAETAAEERIAAAVSALDRYGGVARVERVVLLEETARTWRPLADAALGPRTVVGKGGLELEITRGTLIDPEAFALVDASGVSAAPQAGTAPPAAAQAATGPVRRLDGRPFPVVLTARREGVVVGLAVAWRSLASGHVGVLVSAEARGQGIGAHLIAHLEAAVRRLGWDDRVLEAVGPRAFYEARSNWSRVAAETPTRTRPPRTSRAS